jgi:putative colanic acid biosynthesis glycosyltransferase
MKIALLDVNYRFSSTGKILADLKSGLGARGHDVLAAYGRGPKVQEPNVHRFAPPWEVAAHALASRVTGLNACFSPRATSRVLKLLDDFSPDVVHLHDMHGYFVDIGQLVGHLKAAGVPVVWTAHSEYLYTGKCGYAMDCDRWTSACHHCPQLRAYPSSWGLDFTGHMFAQKRVMFAEFDQLTLAAPSQWLADRMRRSAILNGRDVHVVYNGLDEAVFCPSDREQARHRLGLSGKKVVLTVGSNLLSELKGGRWAIELADRVSDPEVVFVLIGVGSGAPALPANVVGIAHVADQRLLADYYSAADVLLLTSSRETFSMVTAESLACGTPVIGFDAMAPKEVAPEGYGHFVEHGNIQGLHRLLDRVLNQDLILKSAAECVAFARTRYSKSAMVHSYEQLYRIAVGQ